LGLALYYRFIASGFASIAHPLHQLLKKDADLERSASFQSSIEKLKELLRMAPVVLACSCFGQSEEFILEADASFDGLGAVLSQKHDNGLVYLVTFTFRSLQLHEMIYGRTGL